MSLTINLCHKMIAENVAGWLSANGYKDVTAVLTSKNTENIEALIAIFNDINWQTGA